MRLIDADALEAYIKDYACIPCKEYGADRDGMRCDFCGFGFCLEGIKRHTADDETAVDPIKHGQWKPMDLTWGRSIYYCTNCGESAEVPTDMGKPIYMFCPNCGAIMDEVREDGEI